ncbi:MAG TPA: N-acetyl-gamma-glutamyl-phosphate reductase [Rhodospirillaceae bacterium]|jgi:N-acetyl-gamma-glutamyl-phosphate reductase common form|nr:N-acetyl-gamma-glutamyl-phosphate reductase [Alphaproteobacteria bacterium]HBH27010.1 N-acetyl-gamma-glutamyl-phosphate reductase [Rhodospirillaceae bacterium]
MSTIRASIVGVTGFTGLELLRLLRAHPQVSLAHLTSRQHAGEPIAALYPHLAPLPHRITSPDYDTLARDSDVVFLALPHRTAQGAVAALHGKTKVIDLSADYRLPDLELYQKHYGPHAHPELLGRIPYGAPEIVGRAAIAAATTVANPGCYALLVQLLLFPFAGRIAHADVIAITGSSGLGREARPAAHHATRTLRSYNINTHRHISEIARGAATPAERINFLPTSGPFVRGIFATAFIDIAEPVAEPGAVYADAPFVRITDSVALASVVGSNYADVSFVAGQGGRVIAQGALDNLVKGAAGAALQNMNLMCGLPETAGLDTLGSVWP